MSRLRLRRIFATLLAGAALLAATGGGQAARLSIATRGSELAFEPPSLSVRAGQQVSLTFTNRADPSSGLQHNWVLAKKDRKETVVAGALQAGRKNGYVPDSPDVLAHTPLVNPGESQTVRFRAPSEPGDYPYFCTFPGHSDLLKGTLKVTP